MTAMGRKGLVLALCILLPAGFAAGFVGHGFAKPPRPAPMAQDDASSSSVAPLSPQERVGWCCEKTDPTCKQSLSAQACLTAGGRAFSPDKEKCQKFCDVISKH